MLESRQDVLLRVYRSKWDKMGLRCGRSIREHPYMTSDDFGSFLTYLPTLKSDVICGCSLNGNIYQHTIHNNVVKAIQDLMQQFKKWQTTKPNPFVQATQAKSRTPWINFCSLPNLKWENEILNGLWLWELDHYPILENFQNLNPH